jgi:hypothetical protein
MPDFHEYHIDVFKTKLLYIPNGWILATVIIPYQKRQEKPLFKRSSLIVIYSSKQNPNYSIQTLGFIDTDSKISPVTGFLTVLETEKADDTLIVGFRQN